MSERVYYITLCYPAYKPPMPRDWKGEIDEDKFMAIISEEVDKETKLEKQIEDLLQGEVTGGGFSPPNCANICVDFKDETTFLFAIEKLRSWGQRFECYAHIEEGENNAAIIFQGGEVYFDDEELDKLTPEKVTPEVILKYLNTELIKQQNG